jgi:glycerophosphoryl diester phosphodiesterase
MINKSIFLLFAIIVTACSGSPQPAPVAPNVTSAAPAATTAPNASVLIVAHRGGAGLAPENTLASFRNGIAIGADFVEMDANLTKDGVVVIIHDPTIDRTTDGKGRVVDYTLAELQKFNDAAKYANGTTEPQVIPTFDQVLDLVKPTQARMETEIKLDDKNNRYPGMEQKMIDSITAHQMLDRVQISSFSYEALRDVKKLSPRTKTVANIDVTFFRTNDITQPAKTIELMQSYGVDILSVNMDVLSPLLVQEAHKKNIAVEPWTVDTEDAMKKFIAMGADAIITNRPDILKRVLGR